MQLRGLIVVIGLLACGCASVSSEGDKPASLEEMRAESLAKLDQGACAAKGGRVEQAGMLGLWRCTIPYPDAGKLCADDADCEGRCLGCDGITDYEAPAGKATGTCQADDSPFGCYAEIRGGTVQPALCVD